MTRLVACRVTWFEVKQQLVKSQETDLRSKMWGFNKAVRWLLDGYPSGRMKTDGFDASRFCWTHAEDGLSVVYRPAVFTACSVKLRVHACASIHVFDQHTHTHTKTPLPRSHLVPQTDSMIWFTPPPSLPSCLDNLLLYFFFYPRWGKRQADGGQLGVFMKSSLWQGDMLHQSYSCVLTFGHNGAEQWDCAGPLWHDVILESI